VGGGIRAAGGSSGGFLRVITGRSLSAGRCGKLVGVWGLGMRVLLFCREVMK
jgi:hypothetical protein